MLRWLSHFFGGAGYVSNEDMMYGAQRRLVLTAQQYKKTNAANITHRHCRVGRVWYKPGGVHYQK